MRANRDANMPRNVVATCKVMVPTEVETAAGFQPGGADEVLHNFLFFFYPSSCRSTFERNGLSFAEIVLGSTFWR